MADKYFCYETYTNFFYSNHEKRFRLYERIWGFDLMHPGIFIRESVYPPLFNPSARSVVMPLMPLCFRECESITLLTESFF